MNIAVVGLGGLCSAAAYWLARRGADVTGFEQFEHHGARLLSIAHWKRDGRADGVLLATVRMLNDGREGEYVFRLEHRGDSWKVRA